MRLSVRAIHRLNAVINYLEVGRWMAAQGFDTSRRVLDRRETYEKIAEAVGDVPVLYLEFGVHQGESIRSWSSVASVRRSSGKRRRISTASSVPAGR